jgi:indolepyruvate ferredoxin oxidoreductase
LSGIGGTGVVTVSQVIGTAAMLDGFQVRGLDQTGLSQKAGPVVSDLRLTRGQPRASNRATTGSVDVLLAFDALVAASDAHIAGSSAERTTVVASSSPVATGAMVVHPDLPSPHDDALRRLRAAGRSLTTVDALGVATRELGDPATANVYLLGFAVQLGVIPIDPARIEQAVRLNGVSVESNVAAFRLGRRDALRGQPSDAAPHRPESTEQLIERLAADLQRYQSARYAGRFRDEVGRAAACGDDRFTRAVAVNLHRLMAYKDEYEVARLLLAPESRAAAEAVAGPGARVQWNLHPPLMRSMGLQRKLRLGSWARPGLTALRALRPLRGTPVDPFGRAEVRRVERAMVPEYVDAVRRLVAGFDRIGADQAVDVAELPDQVRGYEALKLRRAEAYRIELADRLARLGV